MLRSYLGRSRRWAHKTFNIDCISSPGNASKHCAEPACPLAGINPILCASHLGRISLHTPIDIARSLPFQETSLRRSWKESPPVRRHCLVNVGSRVLGRCCNRLHLASNTGDTSSNPSVLDHLDTRQGQGTAIQS